jgi:hypoxanthine phosphoribosyltransferase
MTRALRTVVSREDLMGAVERLGGEIQRDHPEGLVLVGVLKGGVCFMADLLRSITVACSVDFLALSPFANGEAKARILKDLDDDLEGRDVVLVEDIIDTGLSSRFAVERLESAGAHRVSICTLLNRPARRIIPLPLRYIGFEIKDDFVVGYGLDYAERYRNLAEIYAVDPAELGADPREFTDLAYGSKSATHAVRNEE